MFSQGDLVHIPQGVTMIRRVGSELAYIITERPEIGIFLKYISKEQAWWSSSDEAEVVTTDGVSWNVEYKKISFKEKSC